MEGTRHADVRIRARDIGMALLTTRDRARGNARRFGSAPVAQHAGAERLPSVAAANPASAQRPLCVKASPPGIVDGRGYHFENARNAGAGDRIAGPSTPRGRCPSPSAAGVA